VTGVARLGESLKAQVRDLARLARAHAHDPDPGAALSGAIGAAWLAAARRHGCRQSDAEIMRLLAPDLDLNTQGLLVWLKRETRS
jgi:hypothetical protein